MSAAYVAEMGPQAAVQALGGVEAAAQTAGVTPTALRSFLGLRRALPWEAVRELRDRAGADPLALLWFCEGGRGRAWAALAREVHKFYIAPGEGEQ